MKNLKIENIYLLFALIFGMIFVFIIPPFQSPDEDTHFLKSYLISKGSLYGVDNGKQIGNYIPENLTEYINEKLGYIGNFSKKYSYASFISDMKSLTVGKQKKMKIYTTLKINPFIYVIPSVGIFISKIISIIMGTKTTITTMLYFGRIFSLILYSLIIYYSIKISPKFKRSMMALALMPMCLTLQSSISYDSLLIAMSFLLFAITLKYIFNDKLKKISKLDIWLICIITFVYLNLKYIYSFNLLILLFIPKEKLLCSKKEMFKRYGLPLAILIILYLLTNIPNYMLNMAKYEVPNQLLIDQRNFILHNPFQYIGIYLKEFFINRYYYISSFIGTIGLLDTHLPTFIIFSYLLYLIITLIIDGSEYTKKINIIQRIICIFIPIIIISLSFLAMYANWTPLFLGVGGNEIIGVQGRYFIPALCMLPFAFVNKLKINKKIVDFISPIFILITLLITLLMIILRFWI